MNDNINVIMDSADDINVSIDSGAIQYGDLQVGQTITGAPGTNASVSNSGTSSHVILNFTIPQGAQGIQGAKGDKGDKGDTGLQGEQGIQGIQGIQGVQGVKGDTGDSGVYIGTQTPTDPDVNVWINPSGGNDELATKQYVDNAIQTAINNYLSNQN